LANSTLLHFVNQLLFDSAVDSDGQESNHYR